MKITLTEDELLQAASDYTFKKWRINGNYTAQLFCQHGKSPIFEAYIEIVQSENQDPNQIRK